MLSLLRRGDREPAERAGDAVGRAARVAAGQCAGSVAEARPWSEVWVKGSHGMLGRFQLRELLGDGGFGQVYQAYDPRLDRDVALKVLRQADPGERVMRAVLPRGPRRGRGSTTRTSSPSTTPAATTAGAGSPISSSAAARCSGSATTSGSSSPTAVRIIRDLADALDHAHRQGVYHRDLKPANVLIDETGRPHLTDFGLARRADFDSDLTRDGAILGHARLHEPRAGRRPEPPGRRAERRL